MPCGVRKVSSSVLQGHVSPSPGTLASLWYLIGREGTGETSALIIIVELSLCPSLPSLLPSDVSSLLPCVAMFAHLISDTILQGSATAHMAPLEPADRKYSWQGEGVVTVPTGHWPLQLPHAFLDCFQFCWRPANNVGMRLCITSVP